MRVAGNECPVNKPYVLGIQFLPVNFLLVFFLLFGLAIRSVRIFIYFIPNPLTFGFIISYTCLGPDAWDPYK